MVQGRGNFLSSSQSGLKVAQHYDLEKMLGLPSQNPHAGVACREQTYKNCFGVL